MNVVSVGDCGVDRYLPLERDRAGGITLNFAVHARRLFREDDRILIVSAIGTDDEAALVTEAIDELPIEAYLAGMPGRTPIQYIDLEPSGEKVFVKYEQGVLGQYRVGDRERTLIAGADLLMAPHYWQIDGFFASVMAAPSRGLRAVDFADFAENPTVENVKKYLDGFDIAFFGLSPSHGELIDELERLAQRAGKLFVVTLGAGGSLALTRSGRTARPAVPVPEVIDTTGAGDTFAAGFLAAYCDDRNVSKALERGAAEAAKTIQKIGAF